MSHAPRLDWQDAHVVIAACGPSLRVEDVERFAGLCPVIAINNLYQHLPWADVLYACDYKWWKHYLLDVIRSGFRGGLWTCSGKAAHEYGVHPVPARAGVGFDQGEDFIRLGLNGGMQAMGLAARWGAARIILLGFDHQPGPKGEKHFHPDHAPAHLNLSPDWPAHQRAMADLVWELNAAHVDVINASRETALQIPRVSVDDALRLVRQAHDQVAA